MHDNLNFEQLEQRRLLAVNVTTGKQGLLSIVGDAGDNDVFVVGTGVSGQVDVYVDGSYYDTFSGIKTIKANMKGGDDLLELTSIQIGGAVTADMGQGDDLFAIDTMPFFGGEGIAPPSSVFIGGSVIAKLGNNDGDQADILTFFAGEGGPGITIGNNVTLAGADIYIGDIFGPFGSSAVDPGDINIGGFLKISNNGRDSSVILQNTNVGGTTVVSLGGGEDYVEVFTSSFARRVAVSMGAGDDDLIVGFSSFAADVVANGGKGDDFLDASTGNVTAFTPVVNGFETII